MMHSNGYEFLFSSDLSRWKDQSSLFFRMSADTSRDRHGWLNWPNDQTRKDSPFSVGDVKTCTISFFMPGLLPTIESCNGDSAWARTVLRWETAWELVALMGSV